MLEKYYINAPLRVALLTLATIGSLILLNVLLANGSNVAEAYVLKGCHEADHDANYVDVHFAWGTNLQTPGSAWRTAWSTGMQDWEDANTDHVILFWPDSTSAHKINSIWDQYNPSPGTFSHNYFCQPHYSSWSLKNNTWATTGWSANERRSTAGHEIGHLLGLLHTTNNSLMDVDRDRSVVYVPKTDDINGVNASFDD